MIKKLTYCCSWVFRRCFKAIIPHWCYWWKWINNKCWKNNGWYEPSSYLLSGTTLLAVCLNFEDCMDFSKRFIIKYHHNEKFGMLGLFSIKHILLVSYSWVNGSTKLLCGHLNKNRLSLTIIVFTILQNIKH